MSFEQARFSQDFQSMAVLMSSMFGGGEATDTAPEKKFDKFYVPKNESELQLALNAVLGRGP